MEDRRRPLQQQNLPDERDEGVTKTLNAGYRVSQRCYSVQTNALQGGLGGSRHQLLGHLVPELARAQGCNVRPPLGLFLWEQMAPSKPHPRVWARLLARNPDGSDPDACQIRIWINKSADRGALATKGIERALIWHHELCSIYNATDKLRKEQLGAVYVLLYI